MSQQSYRFTLISHTAFFPAPKKSSRLALERRSSREAWPGATSGKTAGVPRNIISSLRCCCATSARKLMHQFSRAAQKTAVTSRTAAASPKCYKSQNCHSNPSMLAAGQAPSHRIGPTCPGCLCYSWGNALCPVFLQSTRAASGMRSCDGKRVNRVTVALAALPTWGHSRCYSLPRLLQSCAHTQDRFH